MDVIGNSFVGREAEMAALRAALEESVSGRGRLVLLVGEPGIGKTRTADELASEARQRDVRVLVGRCHEGGGAPAFWPWRQVIRDLARDRDTATLAVALGPGAAEIARITPEIRQRLPYLPTLPALDDAQARFRLFDSITAMLTGTARKTPLLIILDDLHAADASSLLLLQFLSREMAAARLLVVGTYRDVEVARGQPLFQTLGELAREPVTRRLLLRGLSADVIASYIEGVSGAPAAPGLAAAIASDTEGNPFFVCELVRLLVAEGRLHDPPRPGRWTLGVPQSVRAVIGRRLDRLSRDCNDILHVAAVIGREFALPLLSHVAAAQHPVPVLALIEEAAAAHLLAPVPEAVGQWRFSHALIREALYEDLPVSRRFELHRQVGTAIENLYQAQLEAHLPALAHHFFAAAPIGSAEKAVEYAALAAQRATASMAFEEAAVHYRCALQVLGFGQSVNDVQRLELLLALGDAELRSSDGARARQTFRDAVALARELGSAEHLARAALGLGRGWFWGAGAGQDDRFLESLLEEGLQALGQKDSALHAMVLGRLAVARYWSLAPGHGASATSLARQALAMATRVGDPQVRLVALASLHWTDARPETTPKRLGLATSFLHLAEHLGDRAMVLLGHALRLVDLLELGNIPAVDVEIEAFTRLAEELRQPSFLWYAAGFRAMRATMQGRFDEGERWSARTLEIGQRAHSEMAVQAFAAHMLVLRREQGRLAELEGALSATVAQYAAAEHIGAFAWRCALASVHSNLDRPAEVRREFDQLAANDFAELPRDTSRGVALGLLAHACAYLGDAHRAAPLYDLLLPYERRTVVLSFGMHCDGSAARHLGLLATTLSRWDDAERHFEAALEMNARMGSRPLVAHTQHEYAAMLLRRGRSADRERAAALLREAIGTARELGMRRLAEETLALAAHQDPSAREAPMPAPANGAARAHVEPVASPSRRNGPGATVLPFPSKRGRAATHTVAARGAEPNEALQESEDAALRAEALPVYLFRRRGEYWAIAYEGRAFLLRNAKGLQYLAQLLRHPGREFHAVDLAATGRPAPTMPQPGTPDRRSRGLGDAGEMLDRQAKAEYERRLGDLREDLEEARRFNDLGRVARIEQEIRFLTQELARAVGLGGRNRRAASASERARVSVTRTIRAAIAKIAGHDAALGHHLARTVKTGLFCCYTPDPRAPIVWEM